MRKACKYCNDTFTPKRSDSQYCSPACGNNYRARTFRSGTGQTKKFKNKINEFRSSPKQCYQVQKHTAKQRGILFLITFTEWWSLWQPYWRDRGRGRMVMCRTGDTGPYEIGNVRIDTHTSNMQEWQEIRRKASDN